MTNLISLFQRGGGLDQGFREAGLITRLAYDVDEACVHTHRCNHPEASALVADLSKIDVDKIIAEWQQRLPDTLPIGLIGGPPCQSFSVSNVHQNDEDPRHILPRHYARILHALNQKYNLDFFVFENVPGLITDKHIEKFKAFKDLFADAGFNIFEGSLNALNFQVPQDRQRVFVVGINKQLHPNFQFHFPEGAGAPYSTVRSAIEFLPEPAYFSKDLTRDTIPFHPNHWCMRPKSPKFTHGNMEQGVIMGRSFRVLSWDQPSYTVAYGHREVHIHPNGHRRLSVLEAMLLQGFTQDYELVGTLSDQIRIVSEAVAPPVGRAIAKALIQQLHINVIPDDQVA